jgi:CcmD family protein
VILTTLALAVVLSVLVPGAVVAAQPPQGGEDSLGAAQPAGGLSAVEERRLRFLFWAYVVIWALLAVFLVSLWLRLNSVHRELGQLRARLESREGARRPSPDGA